MKTRVPIAYYAFGDEQTGEKVVILNDLSAFIQTGYYFGPSNPGNWGKDLNLLTSARKI